MQHTITVGLDHQPVATERLLQVTRHRGFRVEGIMMVSSPATQQQTITLNVSGERPIETLTKQLAKVYHVQHLNVCESPVQQVIN